METLYIKSAILFLNKAYALYDEQYRADISPIDIQFYLARAYSVNGKIDSSIIILENLRQQTTNQQLLANINKELEDHVLSHEIEEISNLIKSGTNVDGGADSGN